MKERNQNNNPFKPYSFQREDAIRQSGFFVSRTRATKRRQDGSLGSNESSFSRHNIIKLNKGKKFLLQEEKNTQIQRSNRILHEKLAKCARRSTSQLRHDQVKSFNSIEREQYKTKARKKSRKIKTNPTLPSIQKQKQMTNIGQSRYQSLQRSQAKQTMTLFMGHSRIDSVQFKIKIVVAKGVYYLIAQNQHTKIVLQMPEQEYWALHYQEFQENPCKIFQYLVIDKGQIRFRVRDEHKKKGKASRMFTELPEGIKKRKGFRKNSEQPQKLPKI